MIFLTSAIAWLTVMSSTKDFHPRGVTRNASVFRRFSMIAPSK
jgi:hypothetical protein